MTHEFHKSWLKTTAFVIASFAPIMFLGTMEATSWPAVFTVDVLWWPVDGVQQFSAPETRLLSAIMGGLLLGWGMTVYFLSGAAYDAAPEAIRRAVVFGMCSWFLLDSAGSYASGAASNVFFNLLILLVGVGPLWRPAVGEGKAA